jgi:hypothetical protein
VFPELRAEISDEGNPVVYLGAAEPDAALRFSEVLLRARAPDDRGPPWGEAA